MFAICTKQFVNNVNRQFHRIHIRCLSSVSIQCGDYFFTKSKSANQSVRVGSYIEQYNGFTNNDRGIANSVESPY